MKFIGMPDHLPMSAESAFVQERKPSGQFHMPAQPEKRPSRQQSSPRTGFSSSPAANQSPRGSPSRNSVALPARHQHGPPLCRLPQTLQNLRLDGNQAKIIISLCLLGCTWAFFIVSAVLGIAWTYYWDPESTKYNDPGDNTIIYAV